MDEVWEHASRSIRETGATVLVAVVDHTGSVPGRTGAIMAVSELGCAGTIGGGIAEHRMIERARVFSGVPELVDLEHTPEGSGSLCAGRQTFGLLVLDSSLLETVNAIRNALDEDRFGALYVGSDGLAFEPDRSASRELLRDGAHWTFAITIGKLDTLTIVGGGHVSLALSRIMVNLPFRIVVLDDRSELPTMVSNRFASETRVVDYRGVAEHVPPGDASWVVIMTHGHHHDGLVLRQLLDRPVRYLGMLGSDSKVRKMFDALRGEGFPEESLARVTAPVGLEIGSHTPEEIAISIAAQVVKIKNCE